MLCDNSSSSTYHMGPHFASFFLVLNLILCCLFSMSASHTSFPNFATFFSYVYLIKSYVVFTACVYKQYGSKKGNKAEKSGQASTPVALLTF